MEPIIPLSILDKKDVITLLNGNSLKVRVINSNNEVHEVKYSTKVVHMEDGDYYTVRTIDLGGSDV